jgi:hypothetical protein
MKPSREIACSLALLMAGAAAFSQEAKRPEQARSQETLADKERIGKPSTDRVRPLPMPEEPPPFAKPGETPRIAMLMDHDPPAAARTAAAERDKPRPIPEEPKK